MYLVEREKKQATQLAVPMGEKKPTQGKRVPFQWIFVY